MTFWVKKGNTNQLDWLHCSFLHVWWEDIDNGAPGCLTVFWCCAMSGCFAVPWNCAASQYSAVSPYCTALLCYTIVLGCIRMSWNPTPTPSTPTLTTSHVLTRTPSILCTPTPPTPHMATPCIPVSNLLPWGTAHMSQYSDSMYYFNLSYCIFPPSRQSILYCNWIVIVETFGLYLGSIFPFVVDNIIRLYSWI